MRQILRVEVALALYRHLWGMFLPPPAPVHAFHEMTQEVTYKARYVPSVGYPVHEIGIEFKCERSTGKQPLETCQRHRAAQHLLRPSTTGTSSSAKEQAVTE